MIGKRNRILFTEILKSGQRNAVSFTDFLESGQRIGVLFTTFNIGYINIHEKLEVILQEDEAVDFRWVSFENIEAFMESNLIVPRQKELIRKIRF